MRLATATSTLLALVFAALFLGWLAGDLWRSEQRLRAWPRVQGRIERSGVGQDFIKTSQKSASSTLQKVWTLDLRYTYEVAGVTYAGSRLSNVTENIPVTGTKPPHRLLGIIARYAPGRQVWVSYKPSDPSASYIEIARGRWRGFGIAAASLLFIAASLALMRGPANG